MIEHTSPVRRVLRRLRREAFFPVLAAAARDCACRIYLVGGALREAAIGRGHAGRDWDFAVSAGRAGDVSRQVARQLRGTLIELDARTQTFRIVAAGGLCTLDICAYKAATIRADARARDYTFNALCCDIRALARSEAAPVYDYCGAGDDIRAGTVRAVRIVNIRQDPLRILRGVLYCCRYGFSLESRTAAALHRYRHLLPTVAAERQREELIAIFSCARVSSAVELMDRIGLTAVLFPELTALSGVVPDGYHHLDAGAHSRLTLRKLEALLNVARRRFGAPVATALREYLRGDNRDWLLKLSCLLHDIGKPLTQSRDRAGRTHFYRHEAAGARLAESIGRRFAFARADIAQLVFLVRHHLRAGQLVNRRPSRRAIYRFWRDAGDNAPLLLLLAWADRRAMRGPLSRQGFVFYEDELSRLLVDYFTPRREQPPLVNGHDIMNALSIAPGPLVGRLLRAVTEAQALGRLSERRQALDFARRCYQRRQRLITARASRQQTVP